MPSRSKAQQRLMGMALAAKRGKGHYSGKVKEVADSMSEEQLHDFAKTKSSNLPEKKASMSTQEQAYITGFVKRAADYGYNVDEALTILKTAGIVDGFKAIGKGYKAVANSPVGKWGGRALALTGAGSYLGKGFDSVRDRINKHDYPGAAMAATIDGVDAIGSVNPAFKSLVSKPHAYLKIMQNTRDQKKGLETGSSWLANMPHGNHPAEPSGQLVSSGLNTSANRPDISRLGKPANTNPISTLPTNLPGQNIGIVPRPYNNTDNAIAMTTPH